MPRRSRWACRSASMTASRPSGASSTDGIASLPTSFIDQRDPFGQQFSGCIFGTSGSAPGNCLNGVFQSISTSSYRARGVDAVISAQSRAAQLRGRRGLCHRRFYAPTRHGLHDQRAERRELLWAALHRRRRSTGTSGINANVFANYYESGIGNAPGIIATGATGLYYHNFGRHRDDRFARDLFLQPGRHPGPAIRTGPGWNALSILKHGRRGRRRGDDDDVRRSLWIERPALPADARSALLVRHGHAPQGDGLSRLWPQPGRGLHRHHRRCRRGQDDARRPSDGDDRPRAAARDQDRLDPDRGGRPAADGRATASISIPRA